MNWEEFTSQITRLSNTFGKNAYGEERVKLLWAEIKDLNFRWWHHAVDRMISEFRQAPLLPEFREEISKERERLWKIEKEKNRKDAKDFWEGTYHPDEVKHICKTIRERTQGKVSDEHWEGFMKSIRGNP